MNHCIDFLTKLIQFLEDKWCYDVKGASLLIIVDHECKDRQKNTAIKLIDMASVNKYENPARRDQGLLFGCKNLLNIL